jgi:transposase
MARTSRYPQDVRDRAVRLVLDHRGQYASEWQAITSIAPKVGVHPETLRLWVRRAQIDKGERPGLTTEERGRLMQLERENRELRRANEILKSAASFLRGRARRPTPEMTQYIRTHRERWGVEPICRVLQFAPATYYAATTRSPVGASAARRAAEARDHPGLDREPPGVRRRQGVGAAAPGRPPRGPLHRGTADARAGNPWGGPRQDGPDHRGGRGEPAAGRPGGAAVPSVGAQPPVGGRSDLRQDPLRLGLRGFHRGRLLAAGGGLASLSLAAGRPGSGRPGDGHLGAARRGPRGPRFTIRIAASNIWLFATRSVSPTPAR